MNILVTKAISFNSHIEHFEDHFICDERINGLLICNKILLLT